MPSNSPFAPAPVDLSWLTQLPQQYAAGEKWGREREMRKAFAQGLPKGPDGTVDWSAAADILAKFDPASAFKYAADSQGGTGDFGLNPIYAMGPNGLQLYQPSKSGGVRPVEFPEGVNPLEPQNYLNLGTQFQGAGRYTGQPPAGAGTGAGAPLGSYPIDVGGKAAAEEAGTAGAKAQVNLPVVENSTRRLIGQIEAIEKDPNTKNAIGPVQSRLPTFRSSTADAEARIEQATGGAFLQMYDTLRGAGAITEQEGARAGAALTRLQNLKQSDQGYAQALADAKREVFNLHNVARMKAGQPPLPNSYEGANATSMMRTPAPAPMPQAAPPSAVAAASGAVQSPTGQARPMPSQQQLQLLAQYANDPEAIAAFDEIYGAGAADHFLQGGR